MPTARHTITLAMYLTLAPLAVAGPRVDVNPDLPRGDILSPGWDNWRVPGGPSATATFGGITVTPPGADKVKLTGGWWKPGFDHPARMASDGVTAPGKLEVVLHGLTPGRHSLATYHNTLTDTKAGRITMSVPGGNAVTVTPTSRVTHDA